MAATGDQPQDLLTSQNDDGKAPLATSETSQDAPKPTEKPSREVSPESVERSPRSRRSSTNVSRNSSCDGRSRNGSDADCYQPTGPLRQCLLVAGLTPHVTKAHVAEIFGVYDTVLSVTLGRSKNGIRYAYVEMDSSAGASEAASSTNYGQIDGRFVGVTTLADQNRAEQLLEIGVSSPAAGSSTAAGNRRMYTNRSGAPGRDPHRRPYSGIRGAQSGGEKDRADTFNNRPVNGRLPPHPKNNEFSRDTNSPRRGTAQSSRRNSPARWNAKRSSHRPMDQRNSNPNGDRRGQNRLPASPLLNQERSPSPARRQTGRRRNEFEDKHRESREQPGSRRRRISPSSPSQSPDPIKTRNNKRRISDEDYQRRDFDARRPAARRTSAFDERQAPNRGRSESPVHKRREANDGVRRKWHPPSREPSPQRRPVDDQRSPPPQRWRNGKENHERYEMRDDRHWRSPSPRKRSRDNYRDGAEGRDPYYHGRDNFDRGRRSPPPPQHIAHQSQRAEFKEDARGPRRGDNRRESYHNGSRARDDVKNGDEPRSPLIRNRSISPERSSRRMSPSSRGERFDGPENLGHIDKLRRQESSDSDRQLIHPPSGRSGRRGIQVRGAVGRSSRGGRLSLCGSSDSSDGGSPSTRVHRRSGGREVPIRRSPPPLTSLKTAASRRPRSPSSSSNSLERIAKRRRS